MGTRIGRPPTCVCGSCSKCRNRERAREVWQALSPEERKAITARRDLERARANDRARYQRDKKKRLKAMKAYQETPRGKDRTNAAKRAAVERRPEVRAAHIVAGNAIRDGKLVRGLCEREGSDCRGRIEAHHDDYAKPLEVRWLCDFHYKQIHNKIRALARAG